MLLFYNDLDNMDKNLLLTAIRASLEAGSEIMSVYTDPNAWNSMKNASLETGRRW